MRDIVLKVGDSPKGVNDYERYTASCITKLLQELKKELDIDYSLGQGGSIRDWQQDTKFGIDGGLTIIISVKKWKMRERK